MRSRAEPKGTLDGVEIAEKQNDFQRVRVAEGDPYPLVY